MSGTLTNAPNLAMDDRLRPNPELICRRLGDELVILDADGTNLVTLNETAASIWEMLDGRNTIQSVIDGLTSSYSVDGETAHADVVAVGRRLLSEGLVELVGDDGS
ncbi:MAG: PqqD family protein [Acidobacteriota bacterium]|nr:PqqD family protein [Acidobacteriota bacterium]